MADEFDPLKNISNKSTDDNAKEIPKETVQIEDLLRPTFEPILKIQTPTNPTAEFSTPNSSPYNRLDFKLNAPKTLVRASPSNQTIGKLVEDAPTSVTKPSEQEEWETTEEWEEEEPTAHYNPNYEVDHGPSYYQGEYDQYDGTYKRRGLIGAVSRLVRRLSGLSPSQPTAEEYYEESFPAAFAATSVTDRNDDEAPELVSADQTVARELTAQEIALNDRYSNRLRTQIIRLQDSEETKVVDVSIFHRSYMFFVCDTGRNLIEIFDFNGRRLHFINDSALSRFQPTAIAVADDGTIVIASHFSHCLHMYAPIEGTPPDNAEKSNQADQSEIGFYYQQYKLGSQGHDLHQFYHPAGITIDATDGYLYVCDRGNYRIKVMRPEGICERVIQTIVAGDEPSRTAPIQVACQQLGDQLVCIVGNGDAICFLPKSSDGPTEVEPFYILDHNGLGLKGATGIILDDHDRIFIADTGNHRIIICTSDGYYISHFGSEGDAAGQLKRPCGLDMTADGTLVVADFGNKRLQLFGSMREQATLEESTPSENSTKNPKEHLLIETDENVRQNSS